MLKFHLHFRKFWKKNNLDIFWGNIFIILSLLGHMGKSGIIYIFRGINGKVKVIRDHETKASALNSNKMSKEAFRVVWLVDKWKTLW